MSAPHSEHDGARHLRESAVEQSRRVHLHGPWTSEQALQLALGNIVGLAIVLVSVSQAHDSDSAQAGVAWANVAVVGVTVALAACARWFLQGRELVSLAQASVVQRGMALADQLQGETVIEDGHVVSVPGSGYFHRTDCALVDDRPTEQMTRHEHENAGRVSCPICEP